MNLSQGTLRWLAGALFLGALGAAAWRTPQPAALTFAPPPEARQQQLPTLFLAQNLPSTAAAPRHASLTELPDGRLAAAWLAGDDDNAGIWFSTFGRDGWRAARRIASRESTAGGTFAWSSRTARPLLHAEGSWLHLWYASHNPLGGILLNHSQSTDGGASWYKPSRLPTSPLAGSGGEPGGPPLLLADGGLLLPLAREFMTARGEWLRLAATGEVIAKQRLPAAAPASIALDAQQALAVLRAAGQDQLAGSQDGGQTWQNIAALPGLAPAAPLALRRLHSGKLLLAGQTPSGTLTLWLSDDTGLTWRVSRTLEQATDATADLAEPALLQGRDARIHLLYHGPAQQLRHAVFSEAWLNGEAP